MKRMGLSIAFILVIGVIFMPASASAKVCSGSGSGTNCGVHGSVYTGTFDTDLTSGETAALTSGFVAIKCSKSSSTGKVSNGETGAGQVSSLTFGECISGLGSCTDQATGLPWSFQTQTGTAPNGTMTTFNVEIDSTCSGQTCIYKASEVKATVKGGAPGEIVVTNASLAKQPGSGALCSSTETWSGSYRITSPSSFYLT